ncbi:MAG: hypothetical protein UU08_C0006G0027 [Candidatus Uhrbacteria bacterium GW2011_GWE2_40_58]|nr:MAG: hypothetical protein UT94_C0007G0022 [Candidatus Uhrbacteria bacterium GW2011_GWF2_40_263]KKR67909.1 MAG: hypothetical protein UU08_C0006G0027 [Candidatus Uhrbacteria bacterium GW2011_GWE2_40_58]OGL92509.1 MAG: hypothetical protein A2239_01705 [Candidatus Uhrbacteria bacterium RIFOXYA2_FULL_40_9]OGL96878.1 MAG: hypothetical protein A2332_02040 [Candidatus Uhrbacteria bacterium RIFOXYB2_FULL_41_18]HBK34527.1 hypothetical protein [Candidatus Uhrbacteria bacterium]
MQNAKRGMTLLEVLVVMALVTIIFGVSTVAFVRIQRSFLLQSADVVVAQVLSTAQQRAQSGVLGTSWGVYFPYDEDSRKATELIIFSGETYESRDVSQDLFFEISTSILFEKVDFSGAGEDVGNDHQIVFSLFSGATEQYGSLTLEIYQIEQVLFVSPEGMIVLEGIP